MLSKKVFLAGEPNFSAPPVHAARADVRDHVESKEGDHRASYASDRHLQKRRQATTVFREIWRAAQFSTFSTASARKRRSPTSGMRVSFLGYTGREFRVCRTHDLRRK
jgi:hypothetical protein